MSKTVRRFSEREKNSLARLPSPGGPRVADSSVPREGLGKKLTLMKIQESFLGALLSKCKGLSQCFAKQGRKSPSASDSFCAVGSGSWIKSFSKSSNKSTLNTSTVRKFLSLRLNAIYTKELLLTSHLQSPPGHRQDHFNKPSSETPIVQNLQLATGYHHSLLFCKIKDLEGEGLGLWKLWKEEGKKLPLTQCCQRACMKNKVNGFPFL